MKRKAMKRTDALLASLLLTLPMACAVGPDYVKPEVAKPAQQYKEMKGWKVAQPKDEAPRGKWWKILSEWDNAADPELDALEAQIDISNQTIKQSEASFTQARAMVSEARASFFPNANLDVSRQRTNSPPPSNSQQFFEAPGVIYPSYSASISTQWELDVWGRIRRTVESDQASAQAGAADLAAARLSAQAQLATTYINLRYADEQKRLLDSLVGYYEKTLQLTQNMYDAGISRRSDLVQAQQQLASGKADAIDIGVQRAQYEHAIAVLVGRSPSDFGIPVTSDVPLAPDVPLSVPSELLERRPDIAGAERRVAAANAQLGVSEAGYFPTLKLNAYGAYQSLSFEHFSQLFSNPTRTWSIGPDFSLPILDFGSNNAKMREAVATYDQVVASYRQTVLSGFQEVEDNLAALRILGEEIEAQRQSVALSQRAMTLVLNQYKEGEGRYLDVLTAENAMAKSEMSLLSVEQKRMTAAITLIKALGGGWDTHALKAAKVPWSETFKNMIPVPCPITSADCAKPKEPQ